MDYYFWWRLINVVLVIVTLVYLMLDFRIIRNTVSDKRLYLSFALAGLLIAVLVDTITDIRLGTPLDPQVPIVTASCLWCLIGLWISRGERGALWKEVRK